MKIINTNLSKRNALAAVTAGEVVELKKVASGKNVLVSGYVIQEITNKETGEIFESMVLKTNEGYFATRSESFISSLIDLYETFGDEVLTESGELPIVIYKSTSKNNREFITAGLQEE